MTIDSLRHRNKTDLRHLKKQLCPDVVPQFRILARRALPFIAGWPFPQRAILRHGKVRADARCVLCHKKNTIWHFVNSFCWPTAMDKQKLQWCLVVARPEAGFLRFLGSATKQTHADVSVVRRRTNSNVNLTPVQHFHCVSENKTPNASISRICTYVVLLNEPNTWISLATEKHLTCTHSQLSPNTETPDAIRWKRKHLMRIDTWTRTRSQSQNHIELLRLATYHIKKRFCAVLNRQIWWLRLATCHCKTRFCGILNHNIWWLRLATWHITKRFCAVLFFQILWLRL